MDINDENELWLIESPSPWFSKFRRGEKRTKCQKKNGKRNNKNKKKNKKSSDCDLSFTNRYYKSILIFIVILLIIFLVKKNIN